jgi:hypothetical protein
MMRCLRPVPRGGAGVRFGAHVRNRCVFPRFISSIYQSAKQILNQFRLAPAKRKMDVALLTLRMNELEMRFADNDRANKAKIKALEHRSLELEGLLKLRDDELSKLNNITGELEAEIKKETKLSQLQALSFLDQKTVLRCPAA